MVELFKDGVPRNWKSVLKANGVDPSITREALWDLMNPGKKFCACGAERPFRLTNIARLETCGASVCRNILKAKRTEETSLVKYGTTRPAQAESVKAKTQATFAERFGGHPTQTAEVQLKRKRTNIERYGTATPAIEGSRIAKSIERRRETQFNKYLVDVWPSRIKYIRDELNIEVLSTFISAKSELHCRHTLCGTEWTAVPKPLPICPTCSSSKEEQGLRQFIEELGVPFETNNRTVIKPLELDIYVPSLQVAVEMNGMFWHREGHGCSIAEKTKLANAVGVRLMHISDHDWHAHRDIVKSHIRHLLRCTTNKVNARACTVRFITAKESRQFLEQTHLAGAANAKHHLGMFNCGSLVAVMTLGIPRWGSKDGLELIRFSTVLNTSVRGGFSKLLSYARARLNPSRILSYCDLRTGDGGVYRQSGFTFVGNTAPGYVYFRGREVLARQAAQKHKLQLLLGDLFDKTLTEVQNMQRAGWSRIFDAGHQRWELCSSTACPKLNTEIAEVHNEGSRSVRVTHQPWKRG